MVYKHWCGRGEVAATERVVGENVGEKQKCLKNLDRLQVVLDSKTGTAARVGRTFGLMPLANYPAAGGDLNGVVDDIGSA